MNASDISELLMLTLFATFQVVIGTKARIPLEPNASTSAWFINKELAKIVLQFVFVNVLASAFFFFSYVYLTGTVESLDRTLARWMFGQ